MTTLTVYDPAMCCSTGICGTEVDQTLVDLAADLDWLKAQGVSVRRINLSQEPAEFAANEAIRDLMQESEGDDLPAFLVDGRMVAKARYPSRAELAEWAGVTPPAFEVTERIRELVALGAAIGASCEPCLKYHVHKARELGLSDAQMRDAVAVGRMVKEASARNIDALGDKLIPAEGADGEFRGDAAPAGGCCGGARSDLAKEKAGNCC